MELACTNFSNMEGHVPHHAGHHYWGDKHCWPCDGHSITGYVTNPNQNKFYIQGNLLAVQNASGPTQGDECDGSDFVCIQGNPKFFVHGKGVVLLGYETCEYPGDGTMTSTLQTKLFIGG